MDRNPQKRLRKFDDVLATTDREAGFIRSYHHYCVLFEDQKQAFEAFDLYKHTTVKDSGIIQKKLKRGKNKLSFILAVIN